MGLVPTAEAGQEGAARRLCEKNDDGQEDHHPCGYRAVCYQTSGDAQKDSEARLLHALLLYHVLENAHSDEEKSQK